MRKRKQMFLIYMFLIIFVLILPVSYAIYKGQMNVNITSTTGGLICDVVLDTNENYIENNESFFFVTVNNYKVENGKTILTSTDVNYDLVIENKESSAGLFRYVDDLGNTNSTGESSITISDQYLGKTKSSRKYKVYVTTNTNLKTNVDFKVRLDAKQKDMS